MSPWETEARGSANARGASGRRGPQQREFCRPRAGDTPKSNGLSAARLAQPSHSPGNRSGRLMLPEPHSRYIRQVLMRPHRARGARTRSHGFTLVRLFSNGRHRLVRQSGGEPRAVRHGLGHGCRWRGRLRDPDRRLDLRPATAAGRAPPQLLSNRRHVAAGGGAHRPVYRHGARSAELRAVQGARAGDPARIGHQPVARAGARPRARGHDAGGPRRQRNGSRTRHDAGHRTDRCTGEHGR